MSGRGAAEAVSVGKMISNPQVGPSPNLKRAQADKQWKEKITSSLQIFGSSLRQPFFDNKSGINRCFWKHRAEQGWDPNPPGRHLEASWSPSPTLASPFSTDVKLERTHSPWPLWNGG